MRAEIAGAGLAGLAAAAALAARGWRVTVHERAPTLRAQGYGITLFGNGMRVLRALGADGAAMADGVWIAGLENYDASGTLTGRQVLRRSDGAIRIARRRLVEALAERAMAAGAELRFGSGVARAEQSGALVLDDGTRREADLIIAADGIGSRLRDALPIRAAVRRLPEGATRVLIPRRPGEFAGEAAGFVQEWWSGRRRMLYSAVSPTEIYVTLVCPEADAAARARPLDTPVWQAAFPRMAVVVARVAAEADWSTAHWEQFRVVRLSSWSAGRVAVLGDAAHAMPPNLGQGGGCAMMNALSLAVALERGDAVPVALAAWEASERPLTEHTQRWSMLYSRLALWPRPLRIAALKLTARSAWVGRNMQRTAEHVPTGTERVAA